MADRTIRDFQCGYNVAPTVDAWASANHFRLRAVDADGARQYGRARGLFTGPMALVVRQDGTNVHLETWIPSGTMTILVSRGRLPAEMSIESGGFKGVLPRKICRDAVNRLMAQFGQPLIP